MAKKPKLKNFKDGDKVVMHTCLEATFEKNKDKVWTCQGDSFIARSGVEVVFLEGYRGYFSAEFLRKV